MRIVPSQTLLIRVECEPLAAQDLFQEHALLMRKLLSQLVRQTKVTEINFSHVMTKVEVLSTTPPPSLKNYIHIRIVFCVVNSQ